MSDITQFLENEINLLIQSPAKFGMLITEQLTIQTMKYWLTAKYPEASQAFIFENLEQSVKQNLFSRFEDSTFPAAAHSITMSDFQLYLKDILKDVSEKFEVFEQAEEEE